MTQKCKIILENYDEKVISNWDETALFYSRSRNESLVIQSAAKDRVYGDKNYIKVGLLFYLRRLDAR